MISLVVDDYCHKCKSFSPELQTAYCGAEPWHTVICSERDRCYQIAKYIEQKLKEKENNDD